MFAPVFKVAKEKGFKLSLHLAEVNICNEYYYFGESTYFSNFTIANFSLNQPRKSRFILWLFAILIFSR